MTVRGVGTTTTFPFSRGGRQGGVETPSLFNLVVDFIMGALVKQWDEKGYGFQVEDGSRIHH
eukprot:5288047-Karenia_brevis.AAC.1